MFCGDCSETGSVKKKKGKQKRPVSVPATPRISGIKRRRQQQCLTTNTTVCLFADDIRTSILFSSVSEGRVMKERLVEFMVWGDGGGSF